MVQACHERRRNAHVSAFTTGMENLSWEKGRTIGNAVSMRFCQPVGQSPCDLPKEDPAHGMQYLWRRPEPKIISRITRSRDYVSLRRPNRSRIHWVSVRTLSGGPSGTGLRKLHQVPIRRPMGQVEAVTHQQSWQVCLQRLPAMREAGTNAARG